ANGCPERYRLLAIGVDRHPHHAFAVSLRAVRTAVDGRRLVPGSQVLDLHADRRGRALRGVLFAVSGPDTKSFLGEPGGNLAAATTGDAEKVRQSGPKWGGRQTRPPHFFGCVVRRCNTCRTRSGAASSRTARPLPSSARDKRRSRRR